MQEMWVWSLGWESPLEGGMATNFSILVWTIPWTEEPRGLRFIGLHRIRYNWSNCVHTHAYLPICLNFLKFKFSAPNLAAKPMQFGKTSVLFITVSPNSKHCTWQRRLRRIFTEWRKVLKELTDMTVEIPPIGGNHKGGDVVGWWWTKSTEVIKAERR